MAIALAPWALLSVAAMWGISFVWMKDILDQQDVYSFLASRFIVAVAAMLILRPSTLSKLTLDTLKKGLIIGSALGAGYIFQTLGLDRTTPAITGFITGLYVVLTPLFASIFLKERMKLEAWLYVLLATCGLAILSVKGLSIGTGEIFVLVSAALFAAHILLLGAWSKSYDAYTLTVVQLSACALLSFGASLVQGFAIPPTPKVWGVVIFTSIFATAFAFVIQTWSQARMSTTKVAVILTTEVVFAALFSVVLGREPLTVRLVMGGSMVLIAMLMIIQPRLSSTTDAS